MYYCENCHLLSEEPVCGFCYSRKLRAPAAGDFCYLSTRETPWYDILLDVLYDNGIPWVVKPVRPSAVTIYLGTSSDLNEIFVPYEKLERAKELENSIFSEEAMVEDIITEE